MVDLGFAPEQTNDTRFERFVGALEWPMALLALAVVPAIILEERAASPTLRMAAHLTNWIVWVAFAAEYAIRLALAPSRRGFVRSAWLDLAIIIISPPFGVPDAFQAARSLRALRALRLLRLVRAVGVAGIGLRFARNALQHRRFHFVALFALAVIGLGALGVYVSEAGVNKAIASPADALWWAVVTATTVGYGDVSPVTPEGRIIAVVLMLVGIGVISVFTATIASLFLEADQKSEMAVLNDRLDGVERLLNQILSSIERRQ